MSTAVERVLETGNWRVVFRRHSDRFAHVIARHSGERWIDLLASVEDSPDAEWPASPPLQELHFEERPRGTRLALAVGMAGQGHWSLSVELDPVEDECRFDVACRTPVEPGGLGSRYRLSSTAEWTNDGRWTFTLAACRWQVDNPASQFRQRSEAGEQAEIEVVPLATIGSWPRTLQWDYRLRATS